MDILVYRNFVEIVESGSLTAASGKLLISQPSLSNQLKSLEEDLGAILLNRGARRVELTDAGKIFYEKAKHMNALASSVKQEVRDCVNGQAGLLRMAVTFSNSASLFDGLLLAFQRDNPAIKFQLYETETYEILQLVRSGVVEIGIARSPFQDSSELNFIHEEMEHFVAVYGKDSPWIPDHPGAIDLTELRGIPLCIIRRFECMLSNACLRQGFSPDLLCVNTQLMSNLVWAKNNMGVAIVPQSIVAAHGGEEVTFRPIREVTLGTTRSIITANGRYLSAAAQRFLTLCKSRGFPADSRAASGEVSV